MTHRVLLADKVGIVRDAFRLAISEAADLEVMAEAATEEEITVIVQNVQPDVVLLNIELLEDIGLGAGVAELRAIMPNARIVALEASEPARWTERWTERTVAAAGANAFVTGAWGLNEVIDVLREPAHHAMTEFVSHPL